MESDEVEKICVIGLGYVGLITAVGLASKGNSVVGLEVDPRKIEKVNEGTTPIYEEGLDALLKEVVGKGLLIATDDYGQAVADSKIIFICVPTPSREDGGTELKYIEQVAERIGKAISSGGSPKTIVIKSTVPPGTSRIVGQKISEISKRKLGSDLIVLNNPEFLKEGVAIKDFLEPDRIIIGGESAQELEPLKRLYESFGSPIVETTLETSEMIKYTSNAFLATKVSFANEIGNLCKKLDVDVYQVMGGVGKDRRISPNFLNAGVGFGGSCFPKDVRSLIHLMEKNGEGASLLRSVMEVNQGQPKKMVELAKARLGNLKGKKMAVLGLAFKPNTDDVRESRALALIRLLQNEGANVSAYDPIALENAKKELGEGIQYANSAGECVKDCDGIFILTEWEQFKEPGLYENASLIIDGRYLLAKKSGGNYEGICW